MGLDRFELSTSRLSGGRSNQLSYRPARDLSRDRRLASVPEKRIARGDDDGADRVLPRLNE